MARSKKSTPPRLEFIAECDINLLKEYPENPRLNDKAVPAVAESFKEFGIISPVVVNPDMEICCGHTRVKAAIRLGYKTIPVIVAYELTGNKFIGYNIADNQTAEIADWDEDERALIVGYLQDNKFNVDALGLTDGEYARIMAHHRREIIRMKWSGWNGLASQDIKNRVHPNQKPVELMAFFLERLSTSGDLVLDLYGGSGTTMIACEQSSRVCYMAEAIPAYCDVIVDRWEKLTKGKAQLAA